MISQRLNCDDDNDDYYSVTLFGGGNEEKPENIQNAAAAGAAAAVEVLLLAYLAVSPWKKPLSPVGKCPAAASRPWLPQFRLRAGGSIAGV